MHRIVCFSFLSFIFTNSLATTYGKLIIDDPVQGSRSVIYEEKMVLL